MFCPKCDMLLTIENDDTAGVQRMCRTCDYTQPMEGAPLLQTNIIATGSQDGKLTYSMIYDSAIRSTKKIQCPSASCPSNDVTRWGERLADGNGILIQPDVMQTNYNVDRKTTYICRICGKTFAPAVPTTKPKSKSKSKAKPPKTVAKASKPASKPPAGKPKVKPVVAKPAKS